MKPVPKPRADVQEPRGVVVDLGEIRSPKMPEVVADRLRRQIVRGELKEGDFLPCESALLAQMGVSRAFEPIAARLLARRGLGSGAEPLVELLEEEKKLLDEPRAFAHAAVLFYEEVVRQCGNQILALVCVMLRKLNEEKVEFVLKEHLKRRNPDRATLRRAVREIYDGHVRLLSLVRGRKAAQAEAHWRRHIEALGRYLPSDADRTSIDVLG